MISSEYLGKIWYQLHVYCIDIIVRFIWIQMGMFIYVVNPHRNTDQYVLDSEVLSVFQIIISMQISRDLKLILWKKGYFLSLRYVQFVWSVWG